MILDNIREYIVEYDSSDASMKDMVEKETRFQRVMATGETIDRVVTLGASIGTGISDLAKISSTFKNWIRKKRTEKDLHNVSLKTGALAAVLKAKDKQMIKLVEIDLGNDANRHSYHIQRLIAAELLLAFKDANILGVVARGSFRRVFRNPAAYRNVKNIVRLGKNYKMLLNMINDIKQEMMMSFQQEPDVSTIGGNPQMQGYGSRW